VCISYHGDIFAELIPSNYRRIFTEPFPSNKTGLMIKTLALMGGGGIFKYTTEMRLGEKI
jgi:hypothetical protein